MAVSARYSIVANDPIWIRCPQCKGDKQRQQPLCEDCCNTGEVAEDISWLATLAHNLAIAGGLELAFVLGSRRGRWVSDYFEGWYDDEDEAPWVSGCGKAAP